MAEQKGTHRPLKVKHDPYETNETEVEVIIEKENVSVSHERTSVDIGQVESAERLEGRQPGSVEREEGATVSL
jgi:hypothetical protein